MLLPSALDCDVTRIPPKKQTRALFSSLSLSSTVPSSSQTFSNVYSTCHDLHMILLPVDTKPRPKSWAILHSFGTHSSTSDTKIYSRPHTRLSENDSCNHFKRRSRDSIYSIPSHTTTSRMHNSKKGSGTENQIGSRKKGVRKRKCNITKEGSPNEKKYIRSSPKRCNIVSRVLPKGLGRSDFIQPRALKNDRSEMQNSSAPNSLSTEEKKANEITIDDNRVLVRLVLQKLKTTKNEWDNCAENLGRQRENIGRRWRSLLDQARSDLKDTKEETKNVGSKGKKSRESSLDKTNFLN